MSKPTVFVTSLGCAKNLVDSEVMLGSLIAAHYPLATSPAEADVAVINTCAFIDTAKAEAIETILDISKEKRDGALKWLIVTGCLPQRYKRSLAELLPEVDAFIGTGEFHRIVDIIDTLPEASRPVFHLGNHRYLYDHTTPRVNISPPGSAYVKIGEGCSHGCSFCIIPKIRGPFRTRSPESVVQEVTNLAQQSVREINLVAQDSALYGKGLDRPVTLADLLRQLARIEGVQWIRPLYLNPQTISEELIHVMRDEEKVCTYIDMPIQHCDNEILRAMHRPYDRRYLYRLIEKLRRTIPGVTLRTTLLVGFPGETDAHFQELSSFVEEIEFERLGVFAYSQEEGTLAARLPRQVPQAVRDERRDQIMGIQARISQIKNKLLEDTIQKVIIECVDGNQSTGRIAAQAPEVDGTISVSAEFPLVAGNVYDCRIVGSGTYDLIGSVERQ